MDRRYPESPERYRSAQRIGERAGGARDQFGGELLQIIRGAGGAGRIDTIERPRKLDAERKIALPNLLPGIGLLGINIEPPLGEVAECFAITRSDSPPALDLEPAVADAHEIRNGDRRRYFAGVAHFKTKRLGLPVSRADAQHRECQEKNGQTRFYESHCQAPSFNPTRP